MLKAQHGQHPVSIVKRKIWLNIAKRKDVSLWKWNVPRGRQSLHFVVKYSDNCYIAEIFWLVVKNMTIEAGTIICQQEKNCFMFH